MLLWLEMREAQQRQGWCFLKLSRDTGDLHHNAPEAIRPRSEG